MTATAARMRAAFTAGGSSCARGGAWAGVSAMVSLAPAVEAVEHGLQGTYHEGEADEDQHEHDAEPRVRPLDAERHQEAAVPAPGDEQVRIDEPGDRRREREGKVDERVEEALEREVVAHE